MSERTESELLTRFRRAVERGELDDVRVVYRVSGGEPGERIDEEIRLSGADSASLRAHDELRPSAAAEVAEERLDAEEARSMYRETASALEAMVPRSQARFIPDSTVGMVTIGVGEEEETLYFLADEEQSYGQEERIARGAPRAAGAMREIARRLRQRGGGQQR
jgi:hypothetical protein